MRTCRKIVFWFGDFLSFLGSALPGDQVKQRQVNKGGKNMAFSGRKREKGKTKEGREKGKGGEVNPAALLTLFSGVETWRAAPRMKMGCNCCPLLLRSCCFRSSGEEGGRRNPTCYRSHQEVSCPIGINWHSRIPWDL